MRMPDRGIFPPVCNFIPLQEKIMSYELQGKLIEAYDTVEISPTFKKREFVVERSESNIGRTFTDTIKFQLVQDKCQLLDKFKVGDEIKVSFNIKGSRWEKEGRVSYFNNLDAWRIEKVSEESPIEDITTFSAETEAPYTDDLPF